MATVNASHHVLTPQGPIIATNVHAIPVGGTVRQVGDESHLLDAHGEVIHISPNPRPPSNIKADADPDDFTPRNFMAFGWYSIFSDTTKPEAIAKTMASFTIPPAPVGWTASDVPLFFYSAVSVNAGFTYLMPTLQYGPSAAGGGEYWSTAVWHFTKEHAYYTAVKQVYSGDVVHAVITEVPETNRYTASMFVHGPGETYTAEFGEPFVWMAIGLAPWDREIRPKFPPNPTTIGPIGVSVKGGTGIEPDVTWGTVINSLYGVYLDVDKEGATDSQLTFHYDGPKSS